ANTLGCTCPSFNRPAAAAARVQGPVVSMASSLSDTGGAGGLRWRSAVRSVAAKEQTMEILVRPGDLTKERTDAVVNAANSALRGPRGGDPPRRRSRHPRRVPAAARDLAPGRPARGASGRHDRREAAGPLGDPHRRARALHPRGPLRDPRLLLSREPARGGR